jgi:hypothetical protein
MSIKASLPPGIAPSQFGGTTITSLEDTVAAAEGTAKRKPLHSEKTLVTIKASPRDYIRLTVITPGTELPCSTSDCHRTAKLLADSRDQDVIDKCAPCAYVELANRMVGV